MAFTPVEIIALVVIVASMIKILVLLINPSAWMNFAKRVYAKPAALKVVSSILALIVLYYLLDEVNIVQILAVTVFVALLFFIGLASEVEPLMKKYEARIKKGKLWQDYWFYTLIWVALLAWGAYSIFT